LGLTSSRLWREKCVWKKLNTHICFSGKLLAALFIHKHRHEVKKGFDEINAKVAGHPYT
jgi:hypothetical protein